MLRKKIIYVSALGSSVDSFLVSHLVALKQSGYEVSLISTPDEMARKACDESGVELVPVTIDQNVAPITDLVSVVRLVLIFRKMQPFVVHAHMSKAALLSMIAATFCRVPVRIYHNHGMAYFSSKGLKRKLLGLLEKISCGLATHVIFCGSSTRDAAIKLKVCKKEKAVILGQGSISGLDLKKFIRSMSRSDIGRMKGDLGIESKLTVVGFVGRIVPHKGLDTLMEAWKKVSASTHDKAALVIVGPHHGDSLYRRLQNFEEISQNVHYVGAKSNITEIYQLFDLLLLPSWHEGFPYSVLESQGMGIPAIVTEVTGNIDAVIHDVTGLHVRVNDSDDLAKAIDYLVNNQERRYEMSIESSKRVKESFSEEVVLNNLLGFYGKLVQTKHKYSS